MQVSILSKIPDSIMIFELLIAGKNKAILISTLEFGQKFLLITIIK